MRIFLRRPNRDQLESLVQNHKDDSITCDNPGTTEAWTTSMFKQQPKSETVGDELWKFRREPIGTGETDYAKAVDALLAAKCFDLSWVKCVVDRPFEKDDTFCLSVKAFGLWAVNFCRIIYVKREQDQAEQTVSIGIGTLPVHAAVGEERLSVTMDKASGQVDFLIGSYSKPSSLLARLFAWYLRKRQDVFAVDATERMKQAIRALARE